MAAKGIIATPPPPPTPPDEDVLGERFRTPLPLLLLSTSPCASASESCSGFTTTLPPPSAMGESELSVGGARRGSVSAGLGGAGAATVPLVLTVTTPTAMSALPTPPYTVMPSWNRVRPRM